MSRTDKVFSTLLAVVIGLAGALTLAHWAACESDDSVCLFTGEPSK